MSIKVNEMSQTLVRKRSQKFTPHSPLKIYDKRHS
ncbi:hypothetical protein BMETH_3183_0 [methanotrophic bacterial endosymbiont of Bathymodiolus sp.]|nr:hypothetical protein BMETH_3183_0 [methanotrophic bacterial endosymbiont of Bathymodiolus sp.]